MDKSNATSRRRWSIVRVVWMDERPTRKSRIAKWKTRGRTLPHYHARRGGGRRYTSVHAAGSVHLVSPPASDRPMMHDAKNEPKSNELYLAKSTRILNIVTGHITLRPPSPPHSRCLALLTPRRVFHDAPLLGDDYAPQKHTHTYHTHT